MNYLTNINEIFDVIVNAKERDIKCNLLIGAGCSFTSGIPTSEGVINIIKKKFPSLYQSIEDKTYANCMNILSVGERKDLIKGLVKNSKVNLTHISIAELLKNGYIHRVLTPNFDNLLIKSCSMVNEFPPIYDLASYDDFKPEFIPDQCIFYLHGQFSGNKVFNTPEEVDNQAKKLEKLFKRLNENSMWIIIGYSGKNDAIFKLLENVPQFENRLFWVGYKDDEPDDILMEKLFSNDKYAFYLNGFDSDSFFYELTKRLNIFPPSFILKPFTYLQSIIENIVPFQTVHKIDKNTVDVKTITNNMIKKAIDSYEKNVKLMAGYYNELGLYENTIELRDKLKNQEVLGIAYFKTAMGMFQEGVETKSIELLKISIITYEKSIENNYSINSAFNNIGCAYDQLSRLDVNNSLENIEKSIKYFSMAINGESTHNAYLNNFFILLNTLISRQDFIIVDKENLIKKLKAHKVTGIVAEDINILKSYHLILLNNYDKSKEDLNNIILYCDNVLEKLNVNNVEVPKAKENTA